MQTKVRLGASFEIDIKPEQMQICNAFLILLMIPLFERGVYPLLRRFHIRWGSLGRMATGMLLTGTAFLLAAALQSSIDSSQPRSVSILAQLPQYVVITAGEILFSITGLEFAYSQAPPSMKSVCQAMWLLTVSAGNLLVVVVAESSLFASASMEFVFFAVLIFVAALIFTAISRPFSRSADYLRLSYGDGNSVDDVVDIGNDDADADDEQEVTSFNDE
jgi:dipeptide/tripeptide permease